MRIFDTGENWDSKVNFVDNNNVFVGYDTDQSCCEQASWFISETDHNSMPESDGLENRLFPNLEDYSFDPTFFGERDLNEGRHDATYPELDEGGAVVFRLTSTEGQEAFLYLFNCHNGYYSHGFEFGVDKEVQRKGCL